MDEQAEALNLLLIIGVIGTCWVIAKLAGFIGRWLDDKAWGSSQERADLQSQIFKLGMDNDKLTEELKLLEEQYLILTKPESAPDDQWPVYKEKKS